MPGERWASERRVVVLAVCAVIVLTAVSGITLVRAEAAADRDTLDRTAAAAAAGVGLELTRYRDIGEDIAVAMVLGQVEDQEAFDAVVELLRVEQRLPDLVGTVVVKRIDRSAVVDGVARVDGQIIPVVDDGEQDLLRLVLWARPLPDNQGAIGLDITSRPQSGQAHDTALATGAPALSDAAFVVQIPDEPGAVLHVPLVLPSGANGTLAMVMSGQRILDRVDAPHDLVTLELRDPTTEYAQLLARTGGEPPEDAPRSDAPVADIDQDWFVRASAGPGFGTPWPQRGSTAVFLGGSIVALLVGWLAWSLSSRERLAADLAASRTQELSAVNERLASTNAALADAGRTKDEFLASISHELRTPLTVIAGFVEVLRRGELDGQSATYLDPIERNVRRLDRLVADLLTLVSIDAGAVTAFPERIDLTTLLRRAPRDLVLLDPDDVRLDVADGLVVTADRRHLERLLTNLLNNALRHGAAPIELSGRTEGERVRICVRDHGRGIAEADRLDVFERFARGEASVNVPGTGLGLAIVRELLSINGGSIRYEPAEPGARFVVDLPVDLPADERMAAVGGPFGARSSAARADRPGRSERG
ncbi:MAG: CHASE domain-containing protein [Nitriliruptoraceae bacterium]|nr:CHASE domain-containing protein [Nitriliruptoraceae bacterium]